MPDISPAESALHAEITQLELELAAVVQLSSVPPEKRTRLLERIAALKRKAGMPVQG